MKKIIDVRGLDCPKPVLETKKALDKKEFDFLEIIVDNKAARDNVSRFLTKSGCEIKEVLENKSDFIIKVELGEGGKPGQKAIAEAAPAGGKTLFISSNCMGAGSDELGAKLMQAFIFTLTELEELPERILFMNSGVKLCLKGAATLANLNKLSDGGVDILVCGTCLNFFGLSEQLAVGKVSNMYDIAGHLMEDGRVVAV